MRSRSVLQSVLAVALSAVPAAHGFTITGASFAAHQDIQCPPPCNTTTVTATISGTVTVADLAGVAFELIDEDIAFDDRLVALAIPGTAIAMIPGNALTGSFSITFTLHCDDSCHIEGRLVDGVGPVTWTSTAGTVVNLGNFTPAAVGNSGEACAELAIELAPGGTNFTGGANKICCLAEPDDTTTTDPVDAEGGLVLDLSGFGPLTAQVAGVATIERSGPVEDPDTGLLFVQTEIVAMSLSGTSPAGPVNVRAGRSFGLPPSAGSIGSTSPGSLFPAASSFDVFVEIEIGGLLLRNEPALRLEATIDELPLDETFSSPPDQEPPALFDVLAGLEAGLLEAATLTLSPAAPDLCTFRCSSEDEVDDAPLREIELDGFAVGCPDLADVLTESPTLLQDTRIFLGATAVEPAAPWRLRVGPGGRVRVQGRAAVLLQGAGPSGLGGAHRRNLRIEGGSGAVRVGTETVTGTWDDLRVRITGEAGGAPAVRRFRGTLEIDPGDAAALIAQVGRRATLPPGGLISADPREVLLLAGETEVETATFGDVLAFALEGRAELLSEPGASEVEIRNGVCHFDGCPPGEIRSGGVCFDPLNDPDHCEAPGNSCAGDEVCDGGACLPLCGEDVASLGVETCEEIPPFSVPDCALYSAEGRNCESDPVILGGCQAGLFCSGNPVYMGCSCVCGAAGGAAGRGRLFCDKPNKCTAAAFCANVCSTYCGAQPMVSITCVLDCTFCK